jgi:disintegrin and metalloproteinase domain-containing protein 10
LNEKLKYQNNSFVEPQPAICGNGVVEEGEECDCGWEEDCKDNCCYPMSSAQSALACTLKPG